MLWDRFVRLFHWSLALGIALNYWLLEGGEAPHRWLGYALCALVLVRILWGFVGPDNARFRSFVVGPRRVVASLQDFAADYREHSGHSPLAGWMILLLLALVLSLGVTGWMHGLDAFWGEDWVEDLHEILGNALIAAAAVHVLAVLWIQWRYRLPLLRSMLWRGFD
ncbi:MAG: cytochrome b/b6 domain-containing protein [Halieaceae bacterium]|nr:cytochrome b/b6 domain-containing protein [Halieaceae bacterium]MCP5205349.1 cytochrome b/b6 domain-containing protein [Pseudomonadales bacterium]